MVVRLYLLFHSTHETLKVEGILQGAGVACRVVQKPAAIRMDCGLAVRMAVEARDQALAALKGARIEPRGQFEV
ncbi:MAG: DUF3343 domain-containing protein [Mycobacterium leprae]